MLAQVCRGALLAALALALASGSEAEAGQPDFAWMSGAEIRAAFAGKPIAGLYPSGRPWSETIHDDGTTEYREGENQWQGQWWIRDREFCFSYDPPGVGGCFRVTRVSGNCYELYELPIPQAGDELPPNIVDLWNGRMWLDDQPTTCEARPSA